MAVLVLKAGLEGDVQNGFPSATHWVVDPRGILHIYQGETILASYREWLDVHTAIPPVEVRGDDCACQGYCR